jgi:hypothetical protein
MNRSLRLAIGLAAFAAATCASAQELMVPNTVGEIQVQNIIFPVSATSPLLETPCPGCPPRSHAVSAKTLWLLNKRPVTLAEFHQAVASKPTLILTVKYEIKTNNLISVAIDHLPGAAAPAR